MRCALLLVAVLCLSACSSAPRVVGQRAATEAPAKRAVANGQRADSRPRTPGGVVIPPGYRLMLKDGRPMYCRQELIIGSNVPKTVCVDEDGLRELEWRGQDARDDMTKAEKSCAGGICGESR
jgi:hypothetical protein